MGVQVKFSRNKKILHYETHNLLIKVLIFQCKAIKPSLINGVFLNTSYIMNFIE